MELHLTPDQEALIRQGIAAGRFHGKEDAVREAMSLWEERERQRLEILAAVEQAEASLARGEGRRIATHAEVAQLTEDVKRRGMARLSAEQNLRQ
jgi:Arc/MetJ-type ribon-helix-helix transcriptional regulator